MSDSLERVWRRLQQVIGRGRMTLVDDSKPAQVQQVRLGADELRDGTPRAAEYGFSSVPPVGTDVIVVFIAGERTNGVIVATNNQTFRMRNLGEGEVAIHDDKGRYVLLAAAGITVEGKDSPIVAHTTSDITATAGGNITLQAAAKITLAAPEIFIDTTTLTMAATTIVAEATLFGITSAVDVTGAVGVNGDTTLTGITSIAGSFKVNGIDLGPAHVHGGGTLAGGLTDEVHT